MKYIISITLLLALIVCHPLHAQTLQKAGDAVKGNYASPHPYAASTDGTIQKVWSQTITLEDAYFVMVHFNKIQLGSEDYLIVRNPDNDRSWKYTNEEITRKGGEFWSIHIYGETLEIEIYSKNDSGDYGYDIDQLQKGLPLVEPSQSRAICGTDNTLEAVCYQTSQPAVFSASNKVCRLLTVKSNGSFYGTGWLVGSDNHMMTNEHVITSQTEANNTTYEFLAQTSNCASSCMSQGACAGTVFASSATFVKDNVLLDYCVVKLPLLAGIVTANSLYGFLQLRSQGATIGERLYIPQHPAGWGKRIALVSDNINDPGGLPIVQSKTELGCQGTLNEVGYWADTRGGSSGSPVLGFTDNLVIALHHCKGDGPGCTDMNRGVQIEMIIADLGGLLPPNAVFCPNSLNITANVGPNGYDTQSAGTTINASNTISSTGNAQYDAGTSVKLLPGFRAITGSSFKAYLDGCN